MFWLSDEYVARHAPHVTMRFAYRDLSVAFAS